MSPDERERSFGSRVCQEDRPPDTPLTQGSSPVSRPALAGRRPFFSS